MINFNNTTIILNYNSSLLRAYILSIIVYWFTIKFLNKLYLVISPCYIKMFPLFFSLSLSLLRNVRDKNNLNLLKYLFLQTRKNRKIIFENFIWFYINYYYYYIDKYIYTKDTRFNKYKISSNRSFVNFSLLISNLFRIFFFSFPISFVIISFVPQS